MAFEDWSQRVVVSPAASVGRRRAADRGSATKGAVWEVSDGCAALGAPLQDQLSPPAATPLNTPRPVVVETNAATGEPRLLRRNGREQRVRAVQNHWRIDDEWWRQPIARHYYELELTGGVLLTVFRDLVAGGWWEQRA